ncbi:MAG: transporter substrate-binding domain-containing protein [Lachnospiraceae bacterium]|jgi:polar amino acid transport system substrate-binding protein|nr:transporter substrate-binding domain-containing protein [Lachnospiraceae bacterium]
MKAIKKILSLALVCAMVVALGACGQKTEEKKAASITGPKDLNGKKVGVQTGTTGDIFISDDKELPDVKVERFSKGAEAVQALSQGKLDAVVIDNEPAKAFVKEVKGLKILDTEYVQEDYAIAIKKDRADGLKDKINKALAELKADGTIDKIVSYYIYEDESKRGDRYVPSQEAKTNGKLVMATNAAFPPYEFVESQEIVGIDVDIALAIADKLGMELKIEDMEFDSIISAVQAGKADIGVAGMTVTEDRKKNVDFSDTYYTGRQVIIVKA